MQLLAKPKRCLGIPCGNWISAWNWLSSMEFFLSNQRLSNPAQFPACEFFNSASTRLCHRGVNVSCELTTRGDRNAKSFRVCHPWRECEFFLVGFSPLLRPSDMSEPSLASSGMSGVTRCHPWRECEFI